MAPDRETRKQARAIYRILTKRYPNVRCELDFSNPLELTIATVLSAQCTDKRVNQVTPALFKKYKNVRAYAKAPLADIEDLIYTTGFFLSCQRLKPLRTSADQQCEPVLPQKQSIQG
jgi:endonuclease-3